MSDLFTKFKAYFVLWRGALLGGVAGFMLAQFVPLPEINSPGFLLIIALVITGYAFLCMKVVAHANYFSTTKHKLMEKLREIPRQGGLISHLHSFYLLITLLMVWGAWGFVLYLGPAPLEFSAREYFAIYWMGAGVLLGMYYRFLKFRRDILAYERGEDPEGLVFRWEFFGPNYFFWKRARPFPMLIARTLRSR